MHVVTSHAPSVPEQGVPGLSEPANRGAWTVECGPKDVVWVGHAIRIFVSSRLDDLTLLLVTAPNDAELTEVAQPTRSMPADRRRTSHILAVASGERFRIDGVSVRLEDYRLPDLGAIPLRDRLLQIDAPYGWMVTRDSRARQGARHRAPKRQQG